MTPYNHDTSIFDFEVRIDSECFISKAGFRNKVMPALFIRHLSHTPMQVPGGKD